MSPFSYIDANFLVVVLVKFMIMSICTIVVDVFVLVLHTVVSYNTYSMNTVVQIFIIRLFV
jgi:hypothetical protein